MTRFDAATPEERTVLFADAITAHRKRTSERTTFEAALESETTPAETPTDDPTTVTVDYADRTISMQLDETQRESLDDLLADFPVFKIQQPQTRKASARTVYVSAIADPKHAADFLEAAFRWVYGLPEEYRVWVVRV